MQSDLLLAMALLCGISFAAALLESSGRVARIGIVLGCAAGIAGCLMNLRRGNACLFLGFRLSDTPVQFHLDAGGSWLLLFGLLTAIFAAGLGTTASARPARRYWLAGLSLTLLGTLGVFGLQDAMSFLIAWEVMSLGGAVMILGEGVSRSPGGPMLFMLALLEVGAVAVLLAFLLLGSHAGSYAFASLTNPQASLSIRTLAIGLLAAVRLRRQVGRAAILRMVPRGLRLRQRRHRSHLLRDRSQCSILFIGASGVAMVAPCRRVDDERRDHHDYRWSAERNPVDLQCVSGGRLAAHAESLLG